MGVRSFIDTTSSPRVASARMAASRPEPGPFTNTSTLRRPISCAADAAVSALTCAAYGVFFRDPLNPSFPDEDQDNTFPLASVTLTSTLLNVALINAIPLGSLICFFFLRFPSALPADLLGLLAMLYAV